MLASPGEGGHFWVCQSLINSAGGGHTIAGFLAAGMAPDSVRTMLPESRL